MTQVFLQIFKKSAKKISIINISTTTRTRTNYSAFERSDIGLSFCSDEPLSPRAPSFRILVSFFRYRRFAAVPHCVRPAARGLVVTTEYYWDLLHRSWLCKCMELVFVMGQIFFEKTGFRRKRKFRKKGPILCKKVIFLSFGDIFIFPDVCAIQPNLGTKDFFEKKLC